MSSETNNVHGIAPIIKLRLRVRILIAGSILFSASLVGYKLYTIFFDPLEVSGQDQAKEIHLAYADSMEKVAFQKEILSSYDFASGEGFDGREKQVAEIAWISFATEAEAQKMTIRIDSVFKHEVDVELYNSDKQMVFREAVLPDSTLRITSIDHSLLPNGPYTLRLYFGDDSELFKKVYFR